MMGDVTTIQLRKSVARELKSIKKYPRQTYNEIILDLVNDAKKSARDLRKKENQYDEFLHRIQQLKMKELWDNKEDEVWEDA
jgi:hypothetical protein